MYQHSGFLRDKWTIPSTCTRVVYFDQRTHACVCICMRLHGQKWWKTFENHDKSTFFFMHTRGSCKANEEKRPAFGCQPSFGSHSQSLTSKLFSSFFFMSLLLAWWKRYFFHDFWMFILFSTMEMHAQACVGWSNYTTIHLRYTSFSTLPTKPSLRRGIWQM